MHSSQVARAAPAVQEDNASAVVAAADDAPLQAVPLPSTRSQGHRNYNATIKGNYELLRRLAKDPAQYAEGDVLLDSIVKVYTVHSRPNYFLPWQNHPKRETTGTGFVMHDRLILTNAHVVSDSTYVLVKRHGSGTKYKAEVQAVGHDCDLAILSVEDEDFWTTPISIMPLQFGELPALRQRVECTGYPTGGDNASITSGVVSRVEVTQYVHAASHLMAIQVDSAINPGNSGGPALQDNMVVGVAFQNLPHADSIGFIIPTPVVRHFLKEVSMYGYYRGYCSLGIMCQALENPQLRRALGMSQGQTGVLINTIVPTSLTAKTLRPGDVLISFDGVPIANDGTVHLRQRERIYFSYLITLKPTGAKAHVQVLRQGQLLDFDMTVAPNDQLVPVHQYDKMPSYFIYAGLVFMPLSQPYLHEYGEDWVNGSPRRLYDKAMHRLMVVPEQQIVVMSQVLVDDINTGYQQFQNCQVVRVNGVTVLNLRHLKQLVMGEAHAGAPAAVGDAATAAHHSGNGNGHSNGNGNGNGHSAATAAVDHHHAASAAAANGNGHGNGASPPVLQAVAGLPELPGTDFVRFELEDDKIIIIDRAVAQQATQRIMDRYRVPSMMSHDIVDVDPSVADVAPPEIAGGRSVAAADLLGGELAGSDEEKGATEGSSGGGGDGGGDGSAGDAAATGDGGERKRSAEGSSSGGGGGGDAAATGAAASPTAGALGLAVGGAIGSHAGAAAGILSCSIAVGDVWWC